MCLLTLVRREWHRYCLSAYYDGGARPLASADMAKPQGFYKPGTNEPATYVLERVPGSHKACWLKVQFEYVDENGEAGRCRQGLPSLP